MSLWSRIVTRLFPRPKAPAPLVAVSMRDFETADAQRKKRFDADLSVLLGMPQILPDMPQKLQSRRNCGYRRTSAGRVGK